MEEKDRLDLAPVKTQGALVEIESARAIQEVQAALIIAKRFPRDQDQAHTRIMKACERYSLADKATYAYPRGDTTVTGPSIRLAEVIAQNWQNLEFGVRELSQHEGRSEAEAYAWDIEMNTRQVKTFQVPHVRYTKKGGNVRLTDPRDIYEYVANLGARRMRACILGVVPGDVVEDAVAQCEKTLREGNKKKPIKDRIRLMLKHFDDIGVTQAMLEQKLGHEVNIINEDELVELNKIGRSINDNMTSRDEWFDIKAEGQKAASDLNEKIKNGSETGTKDNLYKTEEPEKKEKKTRKTRKKKEEAGPKPVEPAEPNPVPEETEGDPGTETPTEKILRLVTGARFDDTLDQPSIPCPQRQNKPIPSNWCLQSCKDRVECKQWEAYNSVDKE